MDRHTVVLVVLFVLAMGAGCGSDEPDVRAAQDRMEQEMRALLVDLAPDATVDEEPSRGLTPCGGIEGASWSEVLASHDASVLQPPAPDTLLSRAQEALDDMGVGYSAGAGRNLLTIDGDGYVGSLRLDEETDRLRVSAETDCLDNPDE